MMSVMTGWSGGGGGLASRRITTSVPLLFLIYLHEIIRNAFVQFKATPGEDFLLFTFYNNKQARWSDFHFVFLVLNYYLCK